MGISLSKLDASKIEKALVDLVEPIFENTDVKIFMGARNTSKNSPKMIYCNAPIAIKDLTAVGRTKVRIEIYVEKLGGYKNAIALTELRDPLLEKLQQGVMLGNYRFDYLDEITGDDRANYDFIFINLATLII